MFDSLLFDRILNEGSGGIGEDQISD